MSLYYVTCCIKQALCKSLDANKVAVEEEVSRLTKVGRARFRLPGPKSTWASNTAYKYMAGRRNSGPETTVSAPHRKQDSKALLHPV